MDEHCCPSVSLSACMYVLIWAITFPCDLYVADIWIHVNRLLIPSLFRLQPHAYGGGVLNNPRQTTDKNAYCQKIQKTHYEMLSSPVLDLTWDIRHETELNVNIYVLCLLKGPSMPV